MISEHEMTNLATELAAWVAARDLDPTIVTSLFLRIVIRSSIDAGMPNALVIGALKRGFHMERAVQAAAPIPPIPHLRKCAAITDGGVCNCASIATRSTI